jgi:hypothetical protein
LRTLAFQLGGDGICAINQPESLRGGKGDGHREGKQLPVSNLTNTLKWDCFRAYAGERQLFAERFLPQTPKLLKRCLGGFMGALMAPKANQFD